MSVYNGEKYLKQAIDSILTQDFKDFEFIIVNDASTDKTAQILDKYDNARIKVLVNKKNLGLAKSLNIAIKQAKGEYIARMDDDDISLPSRFSKQLEYLQKYSDVGVLGTQIDVINDKGRIIRKHKIKRI